MEHDRAAQMLLRPREFAHGARKRAKDAFDVRPHHKAIAEHDPMVAIRHRGTWCTSHAALGSAPTIDAVSASAAKQNRKFWLAPNGVEPAGHNGLELDSGVVDASRTREQARKPSSPHGNVRISATKSSPRGHGLTGRVRPPERTSHRRRPVPSENLGCDHGRLGHQPLLALVEITDHQRPGAAQLHHQFLWIGSP